MADPLPAPIGEVAYSPQITPRIVPIAHGWTAFFQPVQRTISVPLFADQASSPVLPPIDGGTTLFGGEGPGQDVLAGGGIEDGFTGIPAWPVGPGRITGFDPTVAGPGTPSGGEGLVIVPLPPAAFMGLAILASLGGISGVRAAVRRRP
jgi:hypothetical protein